MDYANNENFSIYCIKVMFRLWVCLSRKIIEVLAEFIVKIGMFAVSSVWCLVSAREYKLNLFGT